jgi:UDP-glucose 4-epimerase
MAMSPYGESKLITENFIDWYGETYGIKYAILRYFMFVVLQKMEK